MSLIQIGNLALACGAVLRDVELAFATYGNPRGEAILLTHGYTSSHLFANPAGGAEGSWSGLVGPGRAIDTDRHFVISSNMLGSSYGSTAPRSINPATGRPYGPDFPPITLADIVAAQRAMLDRLGIRHLLAVIGPSYGGFQAFTWGAQYPDFMDFLVPVVSGLRAPATDTDALRARLATDRNWNGGHYYEAGGVLDTMTDIRFETLRRYGSQVSDAALRATARAWAEEFDAHSLLTLGVAARAYDATPGLSRIRAPVLYVLSRTDRLFPPSLAQEVMPALENASIPARYVEINSDHGHMASGADAAKWAPYLARLLETRSLG